MSPGQCAARANQLDSAGFLCISSSGTGSPACCGPPYGDLINIFKCTPNYAQLTDSLITESSASGYVGIHQEEPFCILAINKYPRKPCVHVPFVVSAAAAAAE